MEGMKVASRYAQSLLELAQEKNVIDDVLADMNTLLKTTNNNRDFHLFLTSPLIKADKKSQILNILFGDFQELSLKFMHLLTRNHREMYLPLIAKNFIDKVNKLRNIVPITITSAVKLDEGVKESILKKLNENVKGTIELTEEVNKELIGGFVARMGDARIDASVSNQLKKIKKRLLK
ncbi:MAG: ATP synthase F1 subunit delta [Brumimicrobium sp.]